MRKRVIRARLWILLTVIMSVMAIVSILIAADITSSMLNRRQSGGPAVRTAGKWDAQAAAKHLNLQKIEDAAFYCNGVPINDIEAYSAEKTAFFAFDSFLAKFGGKLVFYNSDDIIEAHTGRGGMTLKLGSVQVLLGNKELTMKYPATAACGHILLPAGILPMLGDYHIWEAPEGKALFMNYCKGYDRMTDSGVTLLRSIKGIGTLAGIFRDGSGAGGENASGSPAASVPPADIIIKELTAQNGRCCVLVSGGNAWLWKDGRRTQLPGFVMPGPNATLSPDGRYIYWSEAVNGSAGAWIYDIDIRRLYDAGAYPDMLVSAGMDAAAVPAVEAYCMSGARCRSAVFINPVNGDEYAFIERNGRMIVNGKASLSPGKSRVLFVKGDKCHVCMLDGTGDVLLGSRLTAGWVTENSIAAVSKESAYLFDGSGRMKFPSGIVPRFLGTAGDNTCFYSEGNRICYSGDTGNGTVIELPYPADSVTARSGKGPYIAVSSKGSSIMYIDNGSAVDMGDPGRLLWSGNPGNKASPYYRNFILSGDGAAAVLLNEDGFAAVRAVLPGSASVFSAVLDSTAKDGKNGTVNARWIGNGRLLAYTDRKGWIVDFSGGCGIYEWDEPANSIIEDVMPFQ